MCAPNTHYMWGNRDSTSVVCGKYKSSSLHYIRDPINWPQRNRQRATDRKKKKQWPAIKTIASDSLTGNIKNISRQTPDR